MLLDWVANRLGTVFREVRNDEDLLALQQEFTAEALELGFATLADDLSGGHASGISSAFFSSLRALRAVEKTLPTTGIVAKASKAASSKSPLAAEIAALAIASR